MPNIVSVPIDSIAAGGDGVGRSDGLVVFVPRSAPGDVVTARISGKGRFARGSLTTIVSPSADRTDPPCDHYKRDRCGGCQIQHITYHAQLAAKKQIIADAIQRIGKRDSSSLPDVEPSAKEWRYRTKLTMAIRREGSAWIAGLHRYDHPGQIFVLNDCPITESDVVAAWREVMSASRFFPTAKELRGSVRITSAGATFVLYGGLQWPSSEDFLDAVPSVRALWWEPEQGDRRLVEDRRDEKTPSASFGQVNPEVAAEMQRHLLERIRSYSPDSVVDAYAGLGDTSVELSRAGARVTAIELDAEASEWASQRLPAPSRALRGRVEELIGESLPADVVVINPPRAGIDAAVAEALEANVATTKAVMYVSCNPATLARDLTRLPSYRIASLQPFDMFPQTAHVETVCELVPAA
ncbi:MAG: class I SAM-dependent RNA methyltransferase [Gemmatimonadaceae bacterium]|nr:class I SAM-dependent RNA methyltransferase [Gemmatimonadaceae bacterium]